jgi:RNA polymerase sigma-70 factor (ECF subfamily)
LSLADRAILTDKSYLALLANPLKPEQNTMPIEDSLVSKGVKGENVASWVHLHSDELYSWASHKINDEAVAQDLVQDTFLSAFLAYDSFQGKSNPKTWLFSILNNKITDYYRKSARSAVRLDVDDEKRAAELSDSTFDDNGMWKDRNIHSIWDAESNLLDDTDFQGVLTRCMDDLPSTWRLMMNAKYLLEKESTEICQELDITPSNYWQVLHRAKLMLKKCIELHWFKK